MNERDLRFFRPLWVRLMVTAVVVAWFGFEVLVSHDTMWIAITVLAFA